MTTLAEFIRNDLIARGVRDEYEIGKMSAEASAGYEEAVASILRREDVARKSENLTSLKLGYEPCDNIACNDPHCILTLNGVDVSCKAGRHFVEQWLKDRGAGFNPARMWALLIEIDKQHPEHDLLERFTPYALAILNTLSAEDQVLIRTIFPELPLYLKKESDTPNGDAIRSLVESVMSSLRNKGGEAS